jgi:hypothetical protein
LTDQDLITVLNAIVAELQGIRRELTLLAHPLQAAPTSLVATPQAVEPVVVSPAPARPGIKRPMKTL